MAVRLAVVLALCLACGVAANPLVDKLAAIMRPHMPPSVLVHEGSAHHHHRFAGASLTCKDMGGKAIDWFTVFKFPQLPSAKTKGYAQGFGMSFASKASGKLTPVSATIDQAKGHALAETLNDVYKADNIIMYNDQPPNGPDQETYAHAKGVVAWTGSQGIWLVHSTPKFPQASGPYTYKGAASDFGQTYLCMTLSTKQLEAVVGPALKDDRVWVYKKKFAAGADKATPNLFSVPQDAAARDSKPFEGAQTMASVGGQKFLVIAKNKQWDNNLYMKGVAEALNSDLAVESWMNGDKKNQMDTFCKPKYKYNVVNVRSLNYGGEAAFDETKDHSKWAITTTTGKNTVCIGDINRQYSQAGRGGGTVCFKNDALWNSLNTAIKKRDVCKK